MRMFGKECETLRIEMLKMLQIIKFHSELQEEVIHCRILSTYTLHSCINEVEFSEHRRIPLDCAADSLSFM